MSGAGGGGEDGQGEARRCANAFDDNIRFHERSRPLEPLRFDHVCMIGIILLPLRNQRYDKSGLQYHCRGRWFRSETRAGPPVE